MRLLDTNICIYIIKHHPPEVLRRFERFGLGELAICSITVAELYFGAYHSAQIDRNLTVVEHFLVPFEMIDFDTKAAIEYAKIKSQLRRRGEIIGELDMQIAAIALANDMTVVTNNLKEFSRVEGLRLENWVDGSVG